MRWLRLACPVLMLAAVCAPAPPQKPAVSPPPPKPAVAPALTNPNQAVNDRFAKEVSASIAGRENEPAEKVFKNIQMPWMKTTPAGRLIAIMNFGYSRSLGVACTHCHVEGDFSSDDK